MKLIHNKNLFYSKGEKFFCKHCGDHILTFACDIYKGHALEAEDIDQTEGQAPWRKFERMDCRKCNKSYYEQLFFKG